MHIVTGGAGFIGSAFIWKLNAMGIDDILVVDTLGTGDKWKNLVRLRFTDCVPKDRFFQSIQDGRGPANVEAVIHMGACSSTTERDADYLLANNTGCSWTLARWTLEQGARFLYASSAATYGDGSQGFSDAPDAIHRLAPLNMYGYSKHLFDQWAQRRGMLDQIVGLKFFNVFGPNEYHKGDMASVVFKAFHQVCDGGRIGLFRSARPEYGDGEQLRDFVYVKDVVEVMWELLCRRDVNGLFNLGTGQARSWIDLARAVFVAMDAPENIEWLDMPEALRDRYQYFTEAQMDRLAATGVPLTFRTLEQAVADYIQGYLNTGQPYL